MSVKTSGVGHFTIPTAPAAGTSCTSGAANVFTTTYVQLIASTAAALYITGIYVEEAAVTAGTYIIVQLATGGAGSETIIGQYLIAPQTGSTVTRSYRPIHPHIPVAISTRIACKTADSVGAQAKLITLECIAQSNVVDDGIAVGTVTTVNAAAVSSVTGAAAAQIATGVWQDAVAGDFTTASSIGKSLYIANVAPGAAGGHFIAGTNAATTITTALTTTFTGNLTGSVASVTGAVGSVTGLTASNLDATVSSRMATYTQPTGFLAATFPTGTVANTTNITAGTVTTTTNLTNAPTAGDFTAAMKTSLNAATPASVVGAVGSVTAAVTLPSIPANWITAAGINAAALNGKGDWLLSSGYTAPDNTSITAIKAKTDSLTFTVAAKLDVNVLVVNGITVTGAGTAGSPWGPA